MISTGREGREEEFTIGIRPPERGPKDNEVDRLAVDAVDGVGGMGREDWMMGEGR